MMDLSRVLPSIAMPFMLILVEVGAVVLSLPVRRAGISAFEDPGSFTNPLVFLALLLIFTALILLLIRFAQGRFLALIYWCLDIPDHLFLHLCSTLCLFYQ